MEIRAGWKRRMAHDRRVFACRRSSKRTLIFTLPFQRTRAMNHHAPTGRRKGRCSDGLRGPPSPRSRKRPTGKLTAYGASSPPPPRSTASKSNPQKSRLALASTRSPTDTSTFRQGAGRTPALCLLLTSRPQVAHFATPIHLRLTAVSFPAGLAVAAAAAYLEWPSDHLLFQVQSGPRSSIARPGLGQTPWTVS